MGVWSAAEASKSSSEKKSSGPSLLRSKGSLAGDDVMVFNALANSPTALVLRVLGGGPPVSTGIAGISGTHLEMLGEGLVKPDKAVLSARDQKTGKADYFKCIVHLYLHGRVCGRALLDMRHYYREENDADEYGELSSALRKIADLEKQPSCEDPEQLIEQFWKGEALGTRQNSAA